MVRHFKPMMGAKVLEFDSGDLLGVVNGIIVNPDTGMVEAFWVKPTTIPEKNAVLRVSDILEFKKQLYVRSDRVLAQAEDVIRITEILEDGRRFLGNSAQNEAGESYGRCDDLSFDTGTFVLKQVHTTKYLLGFLKLDERIFPYDRIIRVLPEMILVDDDASKKDTVIVTRPEAAAG